MFPPVNTKDPTAVEVEVQAASLAMFPNSDVMFVPQAFGWAIDCFTGHYPGYQKIDARYHDLEHTMQGTLCMARLLRGRARQRAKPELSRHYFELGLLAILFHDTGYLKERDDRVGTGAKYTVVHVERSAVFAARFLKQKGYSAQDILAVQHMIKCTGVDAVLSNIDFGNEEERVVGHALGTADLLGQMAAQDYVDKLAILYSEFAEAAQQAKDRTHFISMFSSVEDLKQKTPVFWEKYVLPKLDRDFSGLYRYLGEPYPNGRNYYLDRISANIQRLREQLATASV